MFTLNPACDNFLETLDLFIKLLGGAGALVLFFIGIRRYGKEQTSKRKEFVANEMREFTSDKMSRNAMLMLDWTERDIRLFPDKEKYNEQFEKVDREVLKKALQFHELRVKENGKEQFTPIEIAIRDTFDQYLSYFERYWQFVEADLLTPADLYPYLEYWIEAISIRMEEDVRNVIWHYINSYGFSGTQNLFKAFQRNISPNTDISTTA